MGLLNTIRQRLSSLSNSPKRKPDHLMTPSPDPPPSTPPARRRRIHRRRPSGQTPTLRSSSPPFVRRQQSNHKRSTSSSKTPEEITDSVAYAKTCADYLCGQAGSVISLAKSPSSTLQNKEAFNNASTNLICDFLVFEQDQVEWAGYLMEGSEADDPERDTERARLFVQEGMEIMVEVERVRSELEKVVYGKY